MGAWDLFVGIVGLAVIALLVIALRWAALERGRIHREWAKLRREQGEKGAKMIDWCVAMGAVAGCV